MVEVKANEERKIAAAIKRLAEISEEKKKLKKEGEPLKKLVKGYLEDIKEDSLKTTHGYLATVQHQERRYLNAKRAAKDLGVSAEEFDELYKDPKSVTVLTCRRVA